MVKESPGKAFGVWELTSVRVPGGDNLANDSKLQQMISSTEHLCCGFHLRLFQAPVSAGHKHALFLSRLVQCHLWCLQRAGVLSMPIYFIGKSHKTQAKHIESGMGAWEAGR